MLDKIIYFSIHNKLIIGILTLILTIWGGYSLSQLPIDALPDITNNQVQVITVSPSLAAPEIERLVTFPIELSMTNISGIEEIRSFSRFGLSVVTIIFQEHIDNYWARQQIVERLIKVQNEMPKGIGTPALGPISTGLGEIFQYVIRAKKGYESKYSALELRDIQDWIVRRQLLGTEGVADVSSFGGLVKQYEIAVNPERLRSLQISLDDIFKALENNNQNTGGAYIDKKPNAYFIRSEGLIGNREDIEKTVVKLNNNGIPLLVRDVAKVKIGTGVRYGAMTRNTEGEVTGAIILMLKGANSSKVITKVKEKMIQIQKTLPEGVVIEPFLDRTKLVNNAIDTVSQNLIEGALIVIFVLVLMLGNFRAGIIVASVIPLAMLFAIALMNVFGVSGNLMSLGAIDFGLIVDGAVIVVEGTLHHLGILNLRVKLTQSQMDEEVYHSSVKIRSSAAFGEIIIMMVYLPILVLVGIEGKMFKPMAQTVMFAILGAFILSLTYVPMMSAWFLSKKIKYNPKGIAERIIHFAQRIYSPALNFALRRKFIVVSTAFGLLILSLLIFSSLGGEFIPTLDEGDFAVEVRLLPGNSLKETIDFTTKSSAILLKNFPEVKEIIGKIGSAEIPTDPMPIEACDLMVILKDKSEWVNAKTREELADKMKEALDKQLIGVNFSFQQPIQMRFNELMTGAKQDVVVKIFGEDLNILAEYAQKMGKLAQKVEGVSDLYVEQVTGLPQIVIQFNREKIAQFGLSIADANRLIRIALAGETAGLVFEGERRYDLVVRLESENRQTLQDIKNIYINNQKGEQVPLEQIAKVDFVESINQIQREEAKRRIILAFNVRGRDVESTVNDIQGKIGQKVKLPAGYYVTYGGSFKNLQEARARLIIAVPAALSLIFILLFFTFNSLKYSILIFTAIPLSAIGGVLSLWLRGMPFSISAGVGFIALFGVAVLNGIVLIAEFNYLKKNGLTDLNEIVKRGTMTRLRPVLMTAMVASLGFLPMALSHGAGGEVQKPLATVVIGGLVSATLLTLMVLPCLYIYFERGFSIKKTPKSLVWLLLGLISGTLSLQTAQGQTNAQIIDLNQALEIANQNNIQLKISQLEIDYQQKLKPSAFDYGKTNLTWQGGQYNSIRFDNYFSINQNIPLPSVLQKQSQVLVNQWQVAQKQLVINQKELAREVKLAYYQLLFIRSKQQLLLKQDSLFGNFLKAAELRFKTGETSILEKTTAESQVFEMKAFIRQNEADWESELIHFHTLLNQQGFAPAEAELSKRVLAYTIDLEAINLEENILNNNPGSQFLNQQIGLSQAHTRLERSRSSPDITLGYFNQSLIGVQNIQNQDRFFGGNHRFQGVQVGLGIPLLLKAQKSRVSAAKVNELIAQNRLDWFQRSLIGDYTQTLRQLKKWQSTLDFYEQTALKQTQFLAESAQKAFQAGEIGYLEYAQALNRNLMIQSQYLEALLAYNQTVIKIEFLRGE